MKAKKILICSLIAAALCLTLTACMNNGTTQPQSTVQTGFLPEVTNSAAGAGTPNNLNGPTEEPAVFDWVSGAGQIEGNVNRISEIEDSRVVVEGDTALVGVKFANAYQGQMTERIREMVAAEVRKADPKIQTVAVTAEEKDVGTVWELSDQMMGGKPMETLGAKIDEIVRNVTTMR